MVLMRNVNKLPQKWREFPFTNSGFKVNRPLPFLKEKYNIRRMGGKRVGVVYKPGSNKTMTFKYNINNTNNIIYFSK